MKKTKWIAVCMAVMMGLLAAGCDNGSNEPNPVTEESVTLNMTTLTIMVDETQKLTATVTPNGVTVAWSSSNTDVATVDADGMVTPVNVGTTTITAQAGDKTATCEVTVIAHIHNYVDGECKCGQKKPTITDGEIDNRGVLTEYTGNATDLVIPEGVTSIGQYAFQGRTSLESVTLPEGVTEIGNSAFNGCIYLRTVTIPGSMTKIEYAAFKDCRSLIEVTIPDGMSKIEWSTFEGCMNLETVTIPDSVTEIGSKAFKDCWCLTEVMIPDGVKEIEDETFKDCTSLTKVTIPDSVTEIGSKVFWGCTNLKNVTYTGTLAQWCATDYGLLPMSNAEIVTLSDMSNLKSETELVIPEDVTEIKEYVFYGCTSLTSVTIPDSVTKIGWMAFEGCTNITKVTYTGTLADWCGIDWRGSANLLCNANAMLYIGGAAVTDAVIPDSVTEIKNYAFEGYTNLKSVMIPDGVTSIGTWAFHGCTGLTSVTIPKDVTNIMAWAFYDCPELRKITYKGTTSQWNAIEKEHDWDTNTGKYTITCSNGSIPKQE